MDANYQFPGRLSSFFSPNKIAHGYGAAKAVGGEVSLLGAKRALVVTDRGVVESGIVEAIKESFLAVKVSVVLYDSVEL